MASPRVVEAEGVTTFHLPPKTSYRYNLQLDDNKLRILMEDITSKKQWCKGNMAKGDYITPANSITDASVPDYIKFFQDVLDASSTSLLTSSEALRSSISVQLRLVHSTRVAKYTFEVGPVSVERIDLLESKLRDQQEELDRFRAGRALPFARFQASTQNPSTHKLLWSAVESDVFQVVKDDIMIRRSGVYCVAARFNNSHLNAVLHKNNGCVQSASYSYRIGSLSTTLELWYAAL